jgi:hypothetical protein
VKDFENKEIARREENAVAVEIEKIIVKDIEIEEIARREENLVAVEIVKVLICVQS